MRARLAGLILMLAATAPAFAQPTPMAVIQHRGDGGTGVPVTRDTPDLMAAHFINVGQGSAAVFEFSCGVMLVDTGGQSEGPVDWQQRLIDYLDALFIRRSDLRRTLDVVYLTHPHPDHVLGVKKLLEAQYDIRDVITDAETGSKGQSSLINFANLHQIPAAKITTTQITAAHGLWSNKIDPLKCRPGGDPDITVLWGSYDESPSWSASDAQNANNHSVAIRVSFGESKFLVTGDMQVKAIRTMLAKYARNLKILDVDVYTAGHHGSHNGTTEPLMRAMSPELAIISAGDPGAREPGGFTAFHHGHPNRQAVDLMTSKTFGVTLGRPPIEVAIGTKGASFDGTEPGEFVRKSLDRAVFSTGWDGDIVVIAGQDGQKTVIIN